MLQLNAWLIMPFVALEFLRVCLNFAALVTGMILLKKNSLDLGPLMGGCTGGGFAMCKCETALLRKKHRSYLLLENK